jgi:hypothetical protein
VRILIIKGQSQYDGTRLFADHAAAAFARRGHDVEVLDAAAHETLEAPIAAYTPGSPLDLIFTINIAGEFRDARGRTLSDLYAAPHVVWHTDYVFSQAPRVRGTPKTTALLVVDPTQAEGVRKLYGDDRFDHLAFFPHPAMGEPAPDDASLAAFCEARPIEVLWAGTFQKPASPWEGVPAPTQAVLNEALERALAVEWMAPLEALDAALTARGVDLDDPGVRMAREAASLVDIEVRRTRRFEFLKAVAKLGLKLHICGAGWESQIYRFKGATYEGPAPMTRVLDLMRRSRLVLNTNGNFGGGSHERPFSASLAGAATFSDRSRYYDEVFEPGVNIELFGWRDLDGGMAALQALAADPERCFAYARGAKALTLAGHTWDRRIDQILEAAAAVRA